MNAHSRRETNMKPVKILVSQDTDSALHLVSDVVFWRDWFRELGSSGRKHGETLKSLLDSSQSYMDRLTIGQSHNPDEEIFFQDVQCIRGIYAAQLDRLKHDVEVYTQLEHRLANCSDGAISGGKHSVEDLPSVGQQYKDAKLQLYDQTTALSAHKHAYMVGHVDRDALRVLAKLETEPDEIHKIQKALTTTTKDIDSGLHNYKKQLKKWKSKLGDVTTNSQRYKTTYLAHQVARAQLVTDTLKHVVENTNVAMTTDRNLVFEGIDVKKILGEHVLDHELVDMPKLECYRPSGDIDEMYERAKTELNIKDVAAMSSTEVNKRLKVKREAEYHIVQENYTRHNIDELNLKQGDVVLKLLPATPEGLAYGQVELGLHNRQKRGYFPVAITKVEKNPEEYRMFSERSTRQRKRAGDKAKYTKQEEKEPAKKERKKLMKMFSTENFLKKLYGVSVDTIENNTVCNTILENSLMCEGTPGGHRDREEEEGRPDRKAGTSHAHSGDNGKPGATDDKDRIIIA